MGFGPLSFVLVLEPTIGIVVQHQLHHEKLNIYQLERIMIDEDEIESAVATCTKNLYISVEKSYRTPIKGV